MSVSPITTHVLDTATGKPAKGLPITLSSLGSTGEKTVIGSGITNDDGRITDLMAVGSLKAGRFQMHFDTATYFKAQGVDGFYPEAVITFDITAPKEHYHIPLLLSPFGYSTYRGS